MIRDAVNADLQWLLALYLHLHETATSPSSNQLSSIWTQILTDKNYHLLVNILDHQSVFSSVCFIIPNLTGGARPYALIENVVTHKNYR